MTRPEKIVYLPGALGSPAFWQPVAERLAHLGTAKLLGWPGFGGVPADPRVRGIDDLVRLVCDELDRPAALVAQSMGGIVAVRAALLRPRRVTHLVLAATSGGVDMADVRAEDWRAAFVAANPGFPRWFIDYREDLSSDIATLGMPVLLLWGDCDPISPVAIGHKLKALLPRATMHVVQGGEHDFAHRRADEVAPLIAQHLL